jgi:hypothetical protein
MSDVCRCGYTKEQHGIAPCHYFRFDHAESSDLDALKAAVRELRGDVEELEKTCAAEGDGDTGMAFGHIRHRLEEMLKGVGG